MTITEPDYASGEHRIALTDTEYGEFGLKYIAVSCPNLKCRRVAFSISLHEIQSIARHHAQPAGYLFGSLLRTWKLLPESEAKPQPDYIPAPIVENYKEACRIKDLSPNASATLSRRCLQGMIRHFWDVKGKRTLWDEIEAIEAKIEPSTWEAIDGIRHVGKIGAHMEQDVNLIIEVEPEEAQLLIGLIEMLFKDWYVAGHEREERVQAMIALGKEKKEQVEAAKEQAAESPKEKAAEAVPEKD